MRKFSERMRFSRRVQLAAGKQVAMGRLERMLTRRSMGEGGEKWGFQRVKARGRCERAPGSQGLPGKRWALNFQCEATPQCYAPARMAEGTNIKYESVLDKKEESVKTEAENREA
jgi:hypothetical protein